MGFSDPYCEIRQAVVVPANSDLKNLKELDGKKVGGQIGTTGLVETCPRPSPKPSSRRTTKWASPSKTSPRATSTQ